MRKIESRTSRIRLAAAIALTTGACQSSPESNPNDFTYRVSVIETSETGTPINDNVLVCFTDEAEAFEQGRAGEMVIYLDNAYCPDENLNKRYIGSSDTQFESISTDKLNMDFINIEVLNQYETYLKCDLPVPLSFEVSQTCAN